MDRIPRREKMKKKENIVDLSLKSDEDLMEMYKMGSESAFDIIFTRYSGRIMGFLSKRLKDAKVADDMLQDVFLKLHRSRHLYKKSLPFSPWLFSVSRSVLLDYFKKKNLEELRDPSDFDSYSAVETNGVPHEFYRDFLQKLHPDQARVITARIYNEETFETIAQQMASTPSNVRQVFSRGVRKMRGFMKSKKGNKS